MNNSNDEPSKPSRVPSGPVDNGSSEDDPKIDLQLVKRAQEGEYAAFDELVTRHRGRIFAMIRNMIHQEADAWDLSQEVFIKAWKALPKFEARARFSTWLYRIAHNVVYDWTRKRKVEGIGEFSDEVFERERIDSDSRTTPSSGQAPDESLATDELRGKIEAALDQLSPEHRQVVVLKDVQGLSYKEIAEVMDSTLGTVMSRLYYARQKLQTLLKDEHEAR